MRFSILASGSRGNACLVRAWGCGLLIDIGLRPRVIEERLEQARASWQSIAAVVLTHTHSDHLDPHSLRRLADERIRLYCHEAHRAALGGLEGFAAMEASRLVHTYDERPWLGPGGMRIEPFALSHDDKATFGFRIEARPRRYRPLRSVGYIADTGTWTEAHVEALADVDLLAVEFNHDVALQRDSGRPAYLIQRILGDRGHLSNDQGAALLARVAALSRRDKVRNVVLLHLSEQCNRPELALAAARATLRESDRRARAVVAQQWTAAPDLTVHEDGAVRGAQARLADCSAEM